jgi:hypothetical protein
MDRMGRALRQCSFDDAQDRSGQPFDRLRAGEGIYHRGAEAQSRRIQCCGNFRRGVPRLKFPQHLLEEFLEKEERFCVLSQFLFLFASFGNVEQKEAKVAKGMWESLLKAAGIGGGRIS